MKMLDMLNTFVERRALIVSDEFNNYSSGGLWTSLTTGSVTVATGTPTTPTSGAMVSALIITGDATQNHDGAVATTNSLFQFLANKPLVYEALLQFTEQNTNNMNLAAGFGSSIGSANFLQNGGAGPATSFSGAIIFKVAGSAVWKTCSSNGSTQTIQSSTLTAGGATPQVLRVEVQPVTSLMAEVTYYVNGQALRDVNNQILKDNVLFASAVAMACGVYQKQGSSTAEITNIDYIKAAQLRQSGPV
jgi:hypothetical protein